MTAWQDGTIHLEAIGPFPEEPAPAVAPSVGLVGQIGGAVLGCAVEVGQIGGGGFVIGTPLPQAVPALDESTTRR